MSCTNDGDPAVYHSIETGLAVLSRAEKVYGHNVIRFDIPALKKVFPDWPGPSGQVLDTLVVAQMRWAHIKDSDYALAKEGKFPARMAGSHALMAWGHRLGCFKGEYTDWCKEQGVDPWSEWRPEMQQYCEQDTEVTRQLVLKIRQSGVSPESVETEHELCEYLWKQEQNGWPFDMEKAVALQARLAARREELHGALVKQFGSWRAPDGKPFVPKRDNARLGYTAGQAVQKYKTVEFNPLSRDHIAKVLIETYGWKPTTFTPTGKPAITEDTLDALAEVPEAALIHEYLTIQKRLGQLAEGKQAWLGHARVHPATGMHHIHHRVIQSGTITHRAAHSNPNLGQVPSVGSPYGAECRELFTVPKGWVLVGADASGLELRCLAHYMARWDGGAYGETVLHGDIHTVNQKAAGLATRAEAKTFISTG